MEALKFIPFKPLIDPSFWHVFSERKIKKFGVSEDPVQIWGRLIIGGFPVLHLSEDAFIE